MSKMEPTPPPLFNTWRPSTPSKPLWLSPTRLWLPLGVIFGLAWILMMPNEPPSGNGSVLTDISRSRCSHSSSNGVTFLLSSITVLPSASFYSIYSELVGGTFLVGLVLETVIQLNQSTTGLLMQDLDELFHHFHQTDDVWDSHFLSFVFFSPRGTVDPIRPRLPEGLADRLQFLGTKRVALVDRSKLELDALTEGPYFATATGLLPVRMLFSDTHAAFVASLVQSPCQTIEFPNATTADTCPNQAIAVPIRAYFTPSHEKPLNSLGVGIKENIDIAGATTFASSLAYGKFHGIKSQHTFATRRFLDLGAVILRKKDMGQFTDAEDPTCDFVHFHAPWDPRRFRVPWWEQL